MILLIILILLIVVFIMSLSLNDEGLSKLYGLSLFFILSCFFYSICIHSYEIALIRKGESLIKIREQSIKDIDNQLSKLKYNHTSLMNADTPAKSLIETKSKYITELTEERLKMQKAKINIEARSIGFFKAIVWLYGKE